LSPVASPASPSPTPQNPRHRQTNLQQRGGGGGDRNSQIKKFLKNIENLGSNSEEEEEEIEIPKSRNSSRTLRTWAAAKRRRRSKFPNQEIPQEH
jgi:hypothetical protein